MNKRQSFSAILLSATLGIALLGASAAQALVIRDIDDPTIASGIINLDIGGTLYDVTWPGPIEAVNVYGELPGVFAFTTFESAQTAVNAIAIDLNAAGGIHSVGAFSGVANQFFNLVFATQGSGLTSVGFLARSFAAGDVWTLDGEQDQAFYLADSRVYASIVPAVIPVPAAVWLFGSALGLLGWMRRKKT
jgi:hypothetical protein